MNVSYIFGAGASCQALPNNNKLSDKLGDFMIKIRNRDFELDYNNVFPFASETISKKAIQLKLTDDLKWIVHNTEVQTIDAFAKQLFDDKNTNGLINLKVALSVYFVYKQLVTPCDKRYRPFLETIFNSTQSGKVKVLSWNYDFQFEKSNSEISVHKDLFSNSKFLNIISKSGHNKSFDKNRFGIIKLNGTTSIVKNDGVSEYMFINTTDKEVFNKEVLDRVLINYAAAQIRREDYYSGISFAWEGQTIEDSIVQKAIEATKNTDILVIIGYSFPDFNKSVDAEIIGSMKNLKKIYYQDPMAEENADKLRAIITMEKIIFERVKECDQFFIPIN